MPDSFFLPIAGEIEVTIEIDDSVRAGMVTLPHGYGMRYRDGAPNGPEHNHELRSTNSFQ